MLGSLHADRSDQFFSRFVIGAPTKLIFSGEKTHEAAPFGVLVAMETGFDNESWHHIFVN